MLPFDEVFSRVSSVLILGFGREGHSSYAFLKKYFPHLAIGVADSNETLKTEGIEAAMHLGSGYMQALDKYDMILKSPGVRLEGVDPQLEKRISSQTDIFLEAYGPQTIGVSGTKGKSTTVSLIYHLLQKSGRKAVLLGNIGKPAFDFIDRIEGDVQVVYELSAHQLERIHHSPHRGVLLNIFPEHLDYFGSYARYRQAKLNLFRFQKPGDYAFCGEGLQDAGFPCLTASGLEEEFPRGMLLQKAGLRGTHNLKNILLAFKVLESMGTPLRALPELLSRFRSLPHRMEFVGNYGGVAFYNDSISTVPQSTLAAIESIPETDTLILGGFDRGLDYRGLAEALSASAVKNFFFLGKAGKRMLPLFEKAGKDKKLLPATDLYDVFEQLKKLPDVRCCLLSPAAASYDQFHNFEHRGDLFKSLAGKFGGK